MDTQFHLEMEDQNPVLQQVITLNFTWKWRIQILSSGKLLRWCGTSDLVLPRSSADTYWAINSF